MSEKKPRTHFVFVLDQSGSMDILRKQAVQNFNELVQQRKLDAKEQDIRISLVTFNGQVYEHLWNEDVERLAEAAEDDYITIGGTALRDALGYTVSKLLESEDANDENTAFYLNVISDGKENSSRHYKVPKYDPVTKTTEADPLKELIESVQATKRWTITYMGCSEEYLHKVSQETSIPISNMAAWSAENASYGFAQSRNSTSSYFAGRREGLVQADCMMSPLRDCCGDWTKSDDTLNEVALDSSVTVCNTGDIKPFQNYTPVSWKT